MTDDIADLKARVDAARDQLAGDTALVQKVELRLNDLAHIVEGSLARQSAELNAAQERLAALEVDLARALARAEQASGEAARADRLGKENGELRQMVMTLLEIIEGRQKSPLAAVMQQLEDNVSALILPAPPARMPDPESRPAEPVESVRSEPVGDGAASEQAISDEPPDEEVLDDEAAPEEIALEEALPDAAPPEDLAEASAIDDLSEIALYDAAEEVVEPGKP